MNTQIYQEACDWFVDVRTGDIDDAGRKGLDAWIRKSPEHLRAYLEIAEIWQDAPLVDPERSSTQADLVTAARAGANVVSLESLARAGLPTPTPPPKARVPVYARYRVAAAALAAVALGGLLLAWLSSRAATYSTAIGEQRTLILPDGSTVQLNARSRIQVRFTTSGRDIELLYGQALFTVEKEPARPFIVHSGATQVQAVGTRFDVYRRNTGTTVTVVEGRVAVAEDNSLPDSRDAETPMVLSAGEQVTMGAKIAPQLTQADIATATAWTQRQLVFHASPLPQVAEEFNRYNARPLVANDPLLKDFRISGVYSSTDPDLLLRFLREQPEINVHEAATEITISSRKSRRRR